MGVNFFIDKAGIQEASMAASQGVLDDAKVKDKKGSSDLPETSVVSDIKEGKRGEIGVKVLRGLVQTMAEAGIQLSPNKMTAKVNRKLQSEYDQMFKSAENKEDQVEISNSNYFIQKTKPRDKQQKNGNQDAFRQNLPAETHELTREYIEVYSKFLVTPSTELKKKIEKLEGELRSKGFSHKDLLSLKTNVKNSIRGEIMEQLKESFIKRTLTAKEKSLKYIIADRQIDQLLESTSDNHRLGGEDFGNYKAGFEEALREMVEQTKAEIREFVKEEVTKKFINLALRTDDKTDDLQEVVNIGKRVDFDEAGFMAFWEGLKDDLGLNLINIPAPNNSALAAGADNRDQQKRSQHQFSAEEEKDLFCNQLRAIYMQRAIKGDFLTALQTAFKMKKLKNGLIKLGYAIQDFKKIEREGKDVAIARFMEMLEEVLAERATLYDFSGPVVKLLDTRKKSILANLERLGAPLGESDINLLIEKIDIRMHDVAMEELKAVTAVLKTGSNTRADMRQKQLVKLIVRLREEAKITAQDLNIPMFKGKT